MINNPYSRAQVATDRLYQEYKEKYQKFPSKESKFLMNVAEEANKMVIMCHSYEEAIEKAYKNIYLAETYGLYCEVPIWEKVVEYCS